MILLQAQDSCLHCNSSLILLFFLKVLNDEFSREVRHITMKVFGTVNHNTQVRLSFLKAPAIKLPDKRLIVSGPEKKMAGLVSSNIEGP